MAVRKRQRMQELTYLGRRRLEWRSVPEPSLGGPLEALVRPVIAARCDGDNLPIFNRVTTAMRAGVALHCLDPVTTDLLGRHPFGRPFAIGHECIAQVVECGAAVRAVRIGQLVIVPWAISCGGCRNCSEGLTSKCTQAGESLLSAYGFGATMGAWGGTAAGIRYALRSLAPGGVCTAVGFYFAKRTGLPLMQMYANSTTLHVGVSHARAGIPHVVDLVARGAFDPLAVATVVADWDDAPQAFSTPATKVVVRR